MSSTPSALEQMEVFSCHRFTRAIPNASECDGNAKISIAAGLRVYLLCILKKLNYSTDISASCFYFIHIRLLPAGSPQLKTSDWILFIQLPCSQRILRDLFQV